MAYGLLKDRVFVLKLSMSLCGRWLTWQTAIGCLVTQDRSSGKPTVRMMTRSVCISIEHLRRLVPDLWPEMEIRTGVRFWLCGCY